MPEIILIAAIDKNNAIGYKNRLLYRIPSDLKRFKEMTTGHTVMMGRKTFESLPKGALPNRRNIVLSHSRKETYQNTEIYASIQEALDSCKDSEKVFIIGGEQIYNIAIEFANKLELTEINATTSEADAFFPKVDKSIWRETQREKHSALETLSFDYDYVTYTK